MAWQMFDDLFGCFTWCFTHKGVFEPHLIAPHLLDTEIFNSYRAQVLFCCRTFKTLTVSHSVWVQECP